MFKLFLLAFFFSLFVCQNTFAEYSPEELFAIQADIGSLIRNDCTRSSTNDELREKIRMGINRFQNQQGIASNEDTRKYNEAVQALDSGTNCFSGMPLLLIQPDPNTGKCNYQLPVCKKIWDEFLRKIPRKSVKVHKNDGPPALDSAIKNAT